MDCAICHERRTTFVCPDCNHHSWHPRRRHLIHTHNHNTQLLQQLTTHLTHHSLLQQRQQQHTTLHTRLDQLHHLLTTEQTNLDRLRAINRARRTLLAHRQEVVVKADSLLHNKLHRLVQQQLPDHLSLLDTRLAHSLRAVRRQQSHLLSTLYQLLAFRPLTSSSLSLVGLPLPDELEDGETTQYEQHATALGYLVRVVQLAATYLQVHLPFAMYFHPTFAALSSSSSFLFSTSSAYPPLSSAPPSSSPSSASSSASSAECYVLSAVSWDGRPQSDEYRRSLALIAHNVVFLCRAVGMNDTVRLWRVGGNMLDLPQAVSIGLYERRRQQVVNEKATRDEQWVRQRDREEKEREDEDEAEVSVVDETTHGSEVAYGSRLHAGKLDGVVSGVSGGGIVRSVRFAAIAVANVNVDDAEWDMVESEQLDEWDDKDDKHSNWTNGIIK